MRFCFIHPRIKLGKPYNTTNSTSEVGFRLPVKAPFSFVEKKKDMSSSPPSNNIWRISCLTKIAASIDNKYTGPQVTTAACLQRDESVPKVVPGANASSASPPKNATPAPPVVYWLKDARHLQSYNPLLFVIQGPSEYTTAKKATEEYKPQDFQLRPRFDPRRPPKVQVEEYTRLRLKEWKSIKGFRKYWNDFFDEMYLNTIEAKAPVLLTTDASGITLEKAQFALYATRLADYFDYYSKKIDEVSGKLNQQLLSLSSDSTGAKKTVKRKRSAISGESSSNSNQSAESDDMIVDDTREQQLLSLTAQMNELRLKFYDPEILAFNERRLQTEAREASRALRTDSDIMRSHYISYSERFQKAVDETFQLIKLKSRADERREIFTNVMRNFNLDAPSAPTRATTTTTTTTTSSNGSAVEEEDEDKEEDDEETNNSATSTSPTTVAEELVVEQVKEALQSYDCLTCCEVVMKIIENWQKYLSCWDQDVVDSYVRVERMSVEIAEHIRRQSEIAQLLNAFDPKLLLRNLRPFASTFFWTRVLFADKLLMAIKALPHWSLALVRALSACERLAIQFNQNYSNFSIYICGQEPPVARSAVRHLLHFLQPAFDNEEGKGEFTITFNWLRKTVLAPSPSAVFERLTKVQAGSGNIAQIELIGYNTATDRLLRFISLTSPNKWTVSDEDWGIAVASLAMQTNHLLGNLKEQRIAFITSASRSITEALANNWFLKSILNPAITCSMLHKGQNFVCPPKESILYCIQTSQPDSIVLDTTSKTKTQFDMPTNFASRPWLTEETEQRQPAQRRSLSSTEQQQQTNAPPPSFWLCNRTNMRQWIDIVTTLKSIKATQLGRWWHDLEFCPTAVDLSIWMTRVIRDFFDAPDDSNGPAGSIVVVLPRLIQLQLTQLVSCDDSEEAAWHEEWRLLGQPKSTDIGRRIILTVASDLKNHIEELGENGYIILAHAEALLMSEWDLICSLFNLQTEIANPDFTNRVFLLYNPVLGGFSNRIEENDTYNTHLLVSYSSEILRRSDDEFRTRGRQLPSQTWIYPPVKASSGVAKTKKNRALQEEEEEEGERIAREEEEDLDLDSLGVEGEEGQIKKAVVTFCTRLLKFRSPKANDIKVNSVYNFIQETHTTNRDWIKGPVVNYLGRLAKVTVPRTPGSSHADANCSLLMTQIQNNIPAYALVEHWVNAGMPTQANVLATNEASVSSFIATLSPLRLANALASSPPGSFVFPSRIIWDQWVSFWLTQPIDKFCAVSSRSYPVAIRASIVGKFTPERFDEVVKELIETSGSFSLEDEDEGMSEADLMQFDSGINLVRHRNNQAASSRNSTPDSNETKTATMTTTTTTSLVRSGKNRSRDAMEIN